MLFFADLRPGEENSGKLVAQVKTMARKKATAEQTQLIIADGPPGIGCAVISSMVGADLIVLVTEPSRSGFHDLERIYHLMHLRGIKGVNLIPNRDGTGPQGQGPRTGHLQGRCAADRGNNSNPGRRIGHRNFSSNGLRGRGGGIRILNNPNNTNK